MKVYVKLISNLNDIDKRVKRVRAGVEGLLYKLHIGCGYYSVVESGFACVNLRRFLVPSGGDRPFPSKIGIKLNFEEWDNMMKYAVEVKESVKVLKDAILSANELDHSNQQGYLNCGHCNPFSTLSEIGDTFEEDNYQSEGE